MLAYRFTLLIDTLDMKPEELRSLRHACRKAALEEMTTMARTCSTDQVSIREIDNIAIDQCEEWHSPYDFGWSRTLAWKKNPAHAAALDVAIWYKRKLAGMCWASPLQSTTKMFVLYLQRSPDNSLPTRGCIAPLCLTTVRYYAWALGFDHVVIQNPLPEARIVYQRAGFTYSPGIGLAYELAQDYAEPNHEVPDHEAQ